MADDFAGRLAAAHGQGKNGLPPHQVRLYEVGTLHLLGKGEAAVRAARRINPAALPNAERRARLATDTARALLALGDHPGTLDELLTVETLSREEACRPSLRALTARIVADRPLLVGSRALAQRTGAVGV